ncbi:type II toxin-antitoxin system RelE family toxin [Micromonospora sp. SH-82]|uniref:type II toxin-antitoxin system RelE family toxin n=1 Tax=Micromonospora sp. SH-82 TaxID=3132938 RepID=UPI003EBC4FDE
MDDLEQDARPAGCRKLVGEDGQWRIRIGDYRVVYAIFDQELVVLVVRVAHRSSVYE